MLFAHGTNHSKGVLILFSENLQIDISHVLEDSEGRYIFVEALVQDAPFLLVNLYAPTKNQEQGVFFDGVANTLENLSLDHNGQIIIGGDFNCHLNSSIDNLGGRIESVRRLDTSPAYYGMCSVREQIHEVDICLLCSLPSSTYSITWYQERRN